MKKNIVFIPTYYYLSNPLYESIYNLLDKKKYKLTYFYTKDPTGRNFTDDIKISIKKTFENFIEIEKDPSWIKNKNNKNSKNSKYRIINKFKFLYNKFNAVFHMRNYSLSIIKILKTLEPDIVVITSDMTLSYRIIKKYLPKLKIIVIQPCFLDFRVRSKKNKFIKKGIINFLYKDIYYPKQQYFGMENNNDLLLLWGDKSYNYYLGKRENIKKIFNPNFININKKIKKLKLEKIKEDYIEKFNFDINKKNLILYISDYSLYYGKDTQLYIEKSYLKVISKHKNKYNFLIKNHPKNPLLNAEKLFQISKCNTNIVVINNLSSDILLSLGDLNISINSNASLEAIVTGMPTINFTPLNIKDNINSSWLNSYCGITATTVFELDNIITNYDDFKNIINLKLLETKNELVGDCNNDILIDILESY